MWELDCEESWGLKNWCFWTVVLEKTLETLWTARRSTQSILKETSPEYSLERLMLKLKLQYFGYLLRGTDSLEKILMLGKWKLEQKGMTEDEMVGWHHWLDGHEFEQALGVGDGQGGLVCCSPWGHKQLDTTEWLNWTELLEKTLESPLDCKEIQPVHPKGNQSWIVIGRTDGWSWSSSTLATWC